MIGPLPAVAPNDDIAALLQFAAFGALFGTVVAARRRARRADADAWLITARWTVAFGAIGLLYVLGSWVLFG